MKKEKSIKNLHNEIIFFLKSRYNQTIFSKISIFFVLNILQGIAIFTIDGNGAII